MKAITKKIYGGPEVLKVEDIPKPEPSADQILVQTKANSANPADWHIMRGAPFFARFSFGLFKPKTKVLGADFSGVVEEVGENVKAFNIGDRVFGESLQGGAFAKYNVVSPAVCGIMPENASFEDMACVPIAGLTALQGLQTHGKVQSGESILINGSSGGVGHFMVQIAKAMGATVTGVCSSRNKTFVEQLGADKVIAYDQEDIHQHNKKYDVVIDTNGNLTLSDFKRIGKRGVVIGFTTMGHMMKLLISAGFSKFPLKQFTAQANTADLNALSAYIESGKVKVHIEKTYPFQQIPEAIGYIESMRTRGKVAMIWD